MSGVNGQQDQLDILIVLGNENMSDGTLKPITHARCERALELYQALENPIIMTTGGLGDHYNPTSIPHAELVRAHLVSKLGDQHAERIIACCDCNNTVEDLFACKERMDQLESNGSAIRSVTVVTSETHYRVALILKCEAFCDRSVDLQWVPTPWEQVIATDGPEKKSLILAHEERSARDLLDRGTVFIGETIFPLDIDNSRSELVFPWDERHNGSPISRDSDLSA